MRITTLAFLLMVALFGCSAGAGSESTASGGGKGGGGSSGTDGLGGTDFVGTGTGPGGGGGGTTGCSDAAKLIYVLSDENELYSFQPAQKVFKPIGTLGCQTSMQPNSMAVDRDAVAWVNYVASDASGVDTAGSIFKVSTVDASCQPTSMTLTSGWYRLGMGFSSDTVGGTAETLYIAGTANGPSSAIGLGKLDFTTMGVKPIGPFSGALKGENAELTGTGDARLFGFFTTTPVQVAEIDKASGATKTPKAMPQVETPQAWAFSFWGGDFYLYTAPNPQQFPTRTSNVSRYRPSDGSVDPAYMQNVGFRIVGAGVSTCAPIEPPK